MAQHFGRFGAMVAGRAPYDPKAALENAELAADTARLPWAGFGTGTDKAASTRAKPEVWTEQAKFREHAEKLGSETAKFAAPAKTNNLDNLKVAFGPAAATCKASHDTFPKE